MMILTKRYGITMKEVYYKASSITVDFHNNTTFDGVCAGLGHTSYWTEMSTAIGGYAKQIWDRVCNEFSNECIYVSEKPIEELTSSECNKIALEHLQKFINVFYNTYDYYSTLLGLYETNKTKLMDKVKSITDNKVKFNDTPQMDNVPTFVGDNYMTNYTHSEGTNESDIAPVMTRLREIQEDFKNVWNDWIYEFRRLFIEL